MGKTLKTSAETGKTSSSPAEATRTALIIAALDLFGRQGFQGTSTREIAAAAKANIGSIAYHFGGKGGLRIAAADHIVQRFQVAAGQALDHMPDGAPLTPEAAQQQLRNMVERMVGFIVASPEAGEIVQFILREMAQPSPALDRIYDGVFEPLHRRLCTIWERATGEEAESECTRLTVFTLIGQVVYFRIGGEAVLRRMGWQAMGGTEAASISAIAADNLNAILAAHTRKPR